jgi:hypothetical protein
MTGKFKEILNHRQRSVVNNHKIIKKNAMFIVNKTTAHVPDNMISRRFNGCE